MESSATAPLPHQQHSPSNSLPRPGTTSLPTTPITTTAAAYTQETDSGTAPTLNGHAHHHNHHNNNSVQQRTETVSTSSVPDDVTGGSGDVTSEETAKPEKKTSKFAALTRIFKPWKWKRRKKPSEKIVKKAVGEYMCTSSLRN